MGKTRSGWPTWETRRERRRLEGPNRAGLSRKHLIDSCEASLRRLKMDYIDLYQIHRLDLETPPEEIHTAFQHAGARAVDR